MEPDFGQPKQVSQGTWWLAAVLKRKERGDIWQKEEGKQSLLS